MDLAFKVFFVQIALPCHFSVAKQNFALPILVWKKPVSLNWELCESFCKFYYTRLSNIILNNLLFWICIASFGRKRTGSNDLYLWCNVPLWCFLITRVAVGNSITCLLFRSSVHKYGNCFHHGFLINPSGLQFGSDSVVSFYTKIWNGKQKYLKILVAPLACTEKCPKCPAVLLLLLLVLRPDAASAEPIFTTCTLASWALTGGLTVLTGAPLALWSQPSVPHLVVM